MSHYQHWLIEKTHNNIVWLGFNRKDTSVNTIDMTSLDELNSILHDIQNDKNTSALVIYSAKHKGFIAGADVTTFRSLDETTTKEFLSKGLAVFSRLENLTIPTVAMIDGFCMGGGFELALACQYRVASDSPDTKIGLPEVLLGIHPGWGGTVRLVNLIGGFNALSQVMLTGASLSASRSKALGLVDDVVPFRQLKRAAEWMVLNMPKRHQPSLLGQISNHQFVRPVVAKLLKQQVSKKVKQKNYPAPFALIDLYHQEGAKGDRAYSQETESVLNLAKGETAPNLIRAFFLREQLKSFAKDSSFKAQHVHVIGAGIMGGDIAAWCALKGLTVTLQDRTYAQIAPAIKRAKKLYEKKLKKPRLVQAALDRLLPDIDGYGIKKADVIIEAVFENLEVKQSIFKKLEKEAKSSAILATNTSSIPLDEISSVMKKPSRLVGIHYFNPVARMDLVEVVTSNNTDKEISSHAASFVNQIGKLPLPVKSSPGFLVNRVLMPYLTECMQLLDEGIKAEDIDASALDFGMMMGPVEMADTVGLDVCLAVAENLTAHFGGQIPEKLRQMVKDGTLGKKTEQGFYRYRQGKPMRAKASLSQKDMIANRLVSRIIKESYACLNEGVVDSPDLLDAGMIFATGFAPFRGGPMHYASSLGKDNLSNLFTELTKSYGDRFKCDVLLCS